jgi:hypothetical protein
MPQKLYIEFINKRCCRHYKTLSYVSYILLAKFIINVFLEMCNIPLNRYEGSTRASIYAYKVV